MDLPPKSSAGASSTSRATAAGRCSAACTATNPPRLEPMSATGSVACVDRVDDLRDHPA